MPGKYDERGTIPTTWHARGVWTGGGAAANCSKADGDWNNGITSVAYNAATGKYLATFRSVGQQIVGDCSKVLRPTATAPLFVCPIRASLSQANKTVEFEIRTEAALTDLATTDKLCIDLEFADFPPNS